MVLNARAYAKINLFLNVISKREDGYHSIDTIMQNVSLYDEVSLQLTDGGIEVCCDNDDIAGESNIVFSACREFLSNLDDDVGVKVFIKKNIPIAAGLGGGSSDAAAVLNLLNIALDNVLDDNAILSIASKLGADVPFFLAGGSSRATGIGEKLFKISAPKMHFVLLKEGVKQSTGSMYNKIDSIDCRPKRSAEKIIEALKSNNIDLISKEIYNDFELCWDFEELSKPFIRFDTSRVFLSGSGPTVCALFENYDKAQQCAYELQAQGYNAFYAHSVDCGIELV